MLKIYGIKNCDTMKKAFSWLDNQKIAYEFIDYKKTGVAERHVPDWIGRVGWKTLLNTRGLMWKKLSAEERTDIDETKALALLCKYPSLIKRPVLDTGENMLIGFLPELYQKELKQ